MWATAPYLEERVEEVCDNDDEREGDGGVGVLAVDGHHEDTDVDAAKDLHHADQYYLPHPRMQRTLSFSEVLLFLLLLLPLLLLLLLLLFILLLPQGTDVEICLHTR